MKTAFTIVFLTIFVLFSYDSSLAQGRIKGSITDSTSNNNLVGANVYIMGTALGASTNIEGEYIINDIPSGVYTIKVSYIGYTSKTYDVNIVDNKATLFDIQLVPEVLEGEEVLITAQASGQISAINQQVNSNTIVNIVSEEKIKELPVLGQKVANLINEELTFGTHQVSFDASSLSSGVYFYKLESGKLTNVKKMMLLK